MPTYVFENQDTGEVTELQMRMSELDDFKKNNPEMKQIITGVNLMYNSQSAKNNKDGGWNELMSKMADANPGSDVANKYKKKSIKDVKIDQVKKKHGF
tara:strand:+ start:9868 stop:10161 length:294 start_codon:yes stop_codon:yes gene_type:complete